MIGLFVIFFVKEMSTGGKPFFKKAADDFNFKHFVLHVSSDSL